MKADGIRHTVPNFGSSGRVQAALAGAAQQIVGRDAGQDRMLKIFTMRFHALILVLLSFPPIAMSCTPAYPPLSELHESEYVFLGEVVGYVYLPESVCVRRPVTKCETAWGIEVSILTPIALPEQPPRPIQIYQFDRGSDCSRIPWSKERVIKVAPLGSRHKVAAKRLVDRGSYLDPGILRLEARTPGSVFIRAAGDVEPSTIPSQFADYSKVNNADGELLFELKKDLVRLRNARSKTERHAILWRLADFHWLRQRKSFLDLLEMYASDPEVAKALEEQYETTLYYLQLLDDRSVEMLLAKRAKRGEAEFQYHLGRHIAHRNPKEAISWLTTAARAGFVTAELELGRLYQSMADREATESEGHLRELAADAYRRAANKGRALVEQGDAWAILMMAELYYSGDGGLPLDLDAAECLASLGMKSKPKGYPIWWLHERAKVKVRLSCELPRN